jgi:hypothetical protein
MTRNQINRIFLSAFVLVAALIAPPAAAAQDPKEPYPTMAPVEQYLMDRDAEMAIAPQRRSRRHLPRRLGRGSNPPRLRDRGPRQKRLGVLGRTRMDGQFRPPGVLES